MYVASKGRTALMSGGSQSPQSQSTSCNSWDCRTTPHGEATGDANCWVRASQMVVLGQLWPEAPPGRLGCEGWVCAAEARLEEMKGGSSQPRPRRLRARPMSHEVLWGAMAVEVGFILGSKALVVLVQNTNQDRRKNATKWEFKWMLVNIAAVSSLYRD